MVGSGCMHLQSQVGRSNDGRVFIEESVASACGACDAQTHRSTSAGCLWGRRREGRERGKKINRHHKKLNSSVLVLVDDIHFVRPNFFPKPP